MTHREGFDMERQDAFKGVGDYAMGFVCVYFVRYVRKGVWGGASEDSEVGWHGPGD